MPRELSGAAGETAVASRRVRMTPSARVRQIAQVPSQTKQLAIDWICGVVLTRAGERRQSLATGLRCELGMMWPKGGTTPWVPDREQLPIPVVIEARPRDD